MELTVNVGKDELRQRIQENRARHRTLFEEAVENYRKKLLDELEARIRRVREGRDIEMAIRLQVPEDHTEDYDRVLEMLDMHQGPLIEISQDDFACYARDDWAWKRQWLASTASYTGSPRG